MKSRLCEVCGNEIETDSIYCRFCGSKQNVDHVAMETSRMFSHRTVNLERGMPFVEPAINHLLVVIEEARTKKVNALTIIHGYGSSGKGGVIRRECRKVLDYMCTKGELNCYVPGESFNRKNGMVKHLLYRYPQLSENKNLNKNNPGVTLVVF